MSNTTAPDKKAIEAWKQAPRPVTLTNGQCSTLDTYILLTTSHRKEMVDHWNKMAEIYEELGNEENVAACKSNAQFYAKLEDELKTIRKAIGY